MSEAPKAPDLAPLDEAYEILGEVRDGDSVGVYLARARADGTEVEVLVVSAAPGQAGDNNALAHFASDVQMLSTLSHPAVPRVRSGQWLGTDAFAVIRDRVQGTSLHEQLSSGERFPNTRIAAVLQEVHGVLEWARENGLVHRGVTPATVLFEQRTNRVRVSLAPTPIPMSGIPDACDDARTTGALAWTMFTGEPFRVEKAAARLRELRPDLPKDVQRALASLMQCRNGAEAPDVAAFVAVVAMGDVLRQGEIEAARLQAEIIEAQRAERERWDTERRACERSNAEQAKSFAEERERVASEIAAERAWIATEREELERRMKHVNEDLAALDARRIDMERRFADEASRLASARDEFEALKAEQEERNYEEAVELRDSAAILPVAAVRSVGGRESEMVPAEPIGESLVDEKAPVRAGAGRRWAVPATMAGVIGLLVMVIVAVTHRQESTASTAGGEVGRAAPDTTHVVRNPSPPPAVVTPAVNRDSAAAADSAAQRLAADKARAAKPTPRPAPQTRPVVDTEARRVAADSAALRDSLARRDSFVADSLGRDSVARVNDSATRRDSARDTTRRDSVVTRGRDSVVLTRGRDSVVYRDSARRDSTARPDTTTRRDSTGRPRP